MRENIQEGFQGNLSEIQENLKENIKANIKENITPGMQNNIEELKARKSACQYAKLMAGGMCSLVGTLLAIYVGGWLMILSPLKDAFAAFLVGALTKKMVFVTAIKCAFSLTVSGAIWCGGYILNRKIAGYEDC